MTLITSEQTALFESEVNGNAYEPLYVSLEEYWDTYYEHPDHNYEYNNGWLEEKPVAKKIHVDIFIWFLKMIQVYLEVHPIATLSMLEIGFMMEQPAKIQVRKPDLGIVLQSNPIPFEAEDHRYYGIFDICVEMVSDSRRKEIERDTVVKFGEYEAAGVKEYWLLSDQKKILGFYRLNEQGHYEPVKQTADGVWESAVLPGFRVRVADLWATPPLSQLVNDPVYAEFAFPIYQEARAQVEQERQATQEARAHAEQERQRAEHERQRAEQERQAKEKLEQFLRQQGFDPEGLS